MTLKSGLHSEVCDIDYKLLAIIASRKRCVIQSIQEETATNIYYPTPLVGVLNPPQPGAQPSSGYRNMAMNPMSMQSTGNMGMQMTGGMQGMGMGGAMNGMGMGMNHMGGGMGGMGMGGLNGGYGHPHHRGNSAPSYNPHQHVHYPYQPQPLDINPQTTRGLPYSGPGMQHYGPGPGPNAMNGMGGPGHGHGHGPGPMSVNHTGMSHMSQGPTGYQGNRGMVSPMPMSLSPGPGMHHGHGHGPGPPGLGNGHGHMGMGPPGPGGMGMGMNMPYSPNGQNHLHVGLGAGPMGGVNMGMGMGGMGMNMGMGGGMGQFGAGPHPGLSVHSGEQGVLGKANQIWITGEFFGVQRARDMLLNVAVQKVG